MAFKAYKVQLKPNNKQKTYFEQSFGIARLAFNWGLNLSIKRHEEKLPYFGYFGLLKEFTKIKKSQFPFTYEVTKFVPQYALKDLDTAFTNFFTGIKQNKKVGFPKFKSKRSTKQNFRIQGDRIKLTKTHIKIPKLPEIRLKEYDYIPTENVKYVEVTISKEANKYFASVAVEYDLTIEDLPIEEVIGVDLGIKQLATCSNGQIYNNPKFTKKYEKKLARAQRKLAKKKNGSSNRKKQVNKVAKIHRKIKNCRRDSMHKMTSEIVKSKRRIIVLETLNIKGMLKNHKLAKVIADSSLSEIQRQLEYKVKLYGGQVYKVDRWFPSSKLCSDCGSIKDDLTLADRVYNCDCGLSIDRDLNAAINIRNYYLTNEQNTVSSTGI